MRVDHVNDQGIKLNDYFIIVASNDKMPLSRQRNVWMLRYRSMHKDILRQAHNAGNMRFEPCRNHKLSVDLKRATSRRSLHVRSARRFWTRH